MDGNLVINIKGLSKYYHDGESEQSVLSDLSFSVYSGEFIAISGSSGSGKSTLLNILGLLDPAFDGQYELDDINVHNLTTSVLSKVRNKLVGFIFQDFHLIPHLSVLNNVLLPFLYGKGRWRSKENKKEALRLLDKLGIAQYHNTYPEKLSGGQQQRVAIARALITKPKLILADEPTGNLDKKNTQNIFNILQAINAEGVTVLMVTHDEELKNKASRIIELNSETLST